MVTHKLDTGTSPPFRLRPYRATTADREEIKKQTSEMLDAGIIKESNSPWSSPVCLVPKKDDTKRFCIDYRKLNSITRPMHNPLLRMDDVFDTLSQAQASVFPSLDLCSGYWQVGLDPETAEKSAFASHTGVYQYTRMPIGLVNAPACFQPLMHTVLRKILYKYSWVYLNDVLVFSKDMDEHIQHLNEIFSRFKKANLKLHPSK